MKRRWQTVPRGRCSVRKRSLSADFSRVRGCS